MKSILLTTTALVALAGAAAAEGHTGISFTGEATLGYNDTDTDGTTGTSDSEGFYWDANLGVAMAAELDNGLTAAASFDFDIVDNSNGDDLVSESYVLSLTSETAGMYFGDTAFAAETRWASAGDMEADGFSEADGELALRGDVSMYGVDASVSYVMADADGNVITDDTGLDEDVDQLSVGVAGAFGNFTFSAAYQEESIGTGTAYDPTTANGDFSASEIYAVSGGGSFAGADITLAYAANETSDIQSAGIKVAYPFGPVTATAYYVMEEVGDDAAAGTSEDDNLGLNVAYASGPIAVTLDVQDDQSVTKWGLEGSYDVGTGIMVYAGVLNEDEADDFDFYVAGTYDLGSGASLLFAYAEDESGDQENEVGANEYENGATVEVSFSF